MRTRKQREEQALKLDQSRGDACSCCKHESWSWCPICERKKYGVDCPECGESLQIRWTGIRRSFGESDEEWQRKLKEHEDIVKKVGKPIVYPIEKK